MEQLLAKARAGDKTSEEQLFRYLSARFRAIAIQRIWEKDDAENVAQDACTVVFQKYRTETFTSSFEAWAYGILRRTISNHLQASKAQRQRTNEGSSDRVYEVPAESSEYALERKLTECLRRIGKGNLRYARVLNLSYQGYKAHEICEKLNMSPNALYSVLCRSRSLLKKCLRDIKV